MSLIESLVGAAKGLVTAIAEAKLPHEVLETYPETSQASGARYGRYLLARTEKGFEYRLTSPAAFEPEEARAELVLGHAFSHLSSLADFLVGFSGALDGIPVAEAYLSFVGGVANVHCLTNPDRPEEGRLGLVFDRHPAWHRWSRVGPGFAEGLHADLSHVQIADLLLDNAEDLDEPLIAKHLSSLRAARQVEYDANLSGGGSMGVKTIFGLDRASETQIPREFTARFPAFTGAWWPTGDELADVEDADAAGRTADPAFQARFRLRVMPPKDGASPIFRLIWINARDYEHQARLALGARCREVLKDVARVYLGTPSVHRYILPKGADR